MNLNLLTIPKRLIRQSIGVWPALEWRNRLLMAHRLPSLTAFEDAEVRRLAAGIGKTPRARVACVVPTFRRPEQLVAAVKSILAQDFQDFVVIVVDDGAGLPELPEDGRITVVSLSRNSAVLGLVRNVGIRLTSSDYVAFLDDDNTWTKEHLSLAVKALDGGADFVYTAVRRKMLDGAEYDVLSQTYDRRKLADGNNYIDANSIVLRRSEAGLFSRLPRTKATFPKEDWEFAFRQTRRSRVVHVETPTVEYLVNLESYFTDWKA